MHAANQALSLESQLRSAGVASISSAVRRWMNPPPDPDEPDDSSEQWRVHQIVGDGRCMFRAAVRACMLGAPGSCAAHARF